MEPQHPRQIMRPRSQKRDQGSIALTIRVSLELHAWATQHHGRIANARSAGTAHVRRVICMQATVAPEALVIRFRPTSPEHVLNSALKEYRYSGYYRLSVFADVNQEGEGDAELRARLVKASELSGIDPSSNKKYFVCTRAQKLLERKFTFWKDGDEDEVEEHYSVDLGAQPTIDDVGRFLGVFDLEEKR